MITLLIDFREVLLSVDQPRDSMSNQSDSQNESSRFIVGRVNVLRHYKWGDFDLQVTEAISSYCKYLKGHPGRPVGQRSPHMSNENGLEGEGRSPKTRKCIIEVLSKYDRFFQLYFNILVHYYYCVKP